MGFFSRRRARRQRIKGGLNSLDWPPSDQPGSDGAGLVGEGFFSQGRWKERVARRRKFRVSVSGNRKWILIGVAVVAVCGTIIYLSITYGGGLKGLLL